MEYIENRMVVESEWPHPPDMEWKEVKNPEGPGWVNVTGGVFVPVEDAFAYALGQCVESVPDGFSEIVWTKEFEEMLVEWFYSGNWIKEY